MNLKPIASNMTEVNYKNGSILFSYETPVAFQKIEGNLVSFYQTEKKWSATTTRHIKKWLASFGNPGAQFKPQEYFDNLLNEVK